MINHNKPAVVLSSGGLDSTTVLAIAREQGFVLYSLSFDYGQRHAFELSAAERVARELGVEKHLVIKTDLTGIGGSALTGDIDVPKHRMTDKDESPEIPITYVPARNTIFLSFALAWAEVLEAFERKVSGERIWKEMVGTPAGASWRGGLDVRGQHPPGKAAGVEQIRVKQAI